MALSLSLMKSIFQLFLMLGLGLIIVKTKVLKSSDSKVISKLIIYIVTPCTIVNSFQVQYTSDKLVGLGICIAGAAIVNVVYVTLAKILQKPLGLQRIERATLIYPNAGNLIIPLVMTLPQLGGDWVLYTSGYMIVQTILLWTHCISLISGENQMSLKKIITNCNILAIIVGIIFFLTHFTLPSVVGNVVSNVSSLMGPLSMIVIGMLFADMDFLEIFKEKRTYVICLFRLVVFPTIAIIVIKLSQLATFSPDGTKILLITVLAASAPAATSVTQFAQLYDKHPGYASVMNVMTVIFSIITMPLMVMLYQLL